MVADQELLAIKDTKLKDRLTGAKPLLLRSRPMAALSSGAFTPDCLDLVEQAVVDTLEQADVDSWCNGPRRLRQVGEAHGQPW